jgi:hypothetical protein
MRVIRFIGVWLAGALLLGCVNTPQTKMLVTPIGAVGIHSFAPPERPPTVDDIERSRQRVTASIDED